mmetsp:Transcript_15611/g.43153  ORF Transcript_15611/g.43153 Transcript_15611/m.43153 type:complete len:288 (+) Transcript_15611:943-1806(+)
MAPARPMAIWLLMLISLLFLARFHNARAASSRRAGVLSSRRPTSGVMNPACAMASWFSACSAAKIRSMKAAFCFSSRLPVRNCSSCPAKAGLGLPSLCTADSSWCSRLLTNGGSRAERVAAGTATAGGGAVGPAAASCGDAAGIDASSVPKSARWSCSAATMDRRSSNEGRTQRRAPRTSPLYRTPRPLASLTVRPATSLFLLPLMGLEGCVPPRTSKSPAATVAGASAARSPRSAMAARGWPLSGHSGGCCANARFSLSSSITRASAACNACANTLLACLSLFSLS